MTFPVPSPIRGYSAIDFDTVSLKAAIDALNSLKSTVDSHAGSNGHAGIYSPSANQYYLETNNGNGAGVVQTISNLTWTRLNVAGTVANNNGGGFNSSTDIYTVPASGIYVAQALVRITDSYASYCNVGLGWHTTESDGYWFQWNKYVTGSGGRCSFDYTRVASFNSGDQLRLYILQDGPTMDLTAINLSVWRVG